MDESSLPKDEALTKEASYLYARDPSIIMSYGQRFVIRDLKKNLYPFLKPEQDEKESLSSRDTVSTNISETPANQTIKVFLRMKPFPPKIKLTQEQKGAYTVINSNTLLTKIPSLENTSSTKKVKANDVICRNFIFTQTFDANTSQLELFEQAVKPQMIDFLEGKNSIIMTYGTTNSGKTFTLQGTPDSPGIIPRGIEFVFSNVNPRKSPCFKPVNLCDVVHLNSQERSQELEDKINLLALNPQEKNSYISTYKRMQQLLNEESSIRPSPNSDARYSVWVSFAEIYNESIYDLLWMDCQKKRPALKLSSDSKGRTFIKGLRSVCVNSGAEAYQVLMTGQYNLKVAATALNSKSSRSHCIFTIKLLKYKNEFDPQLVDVSMFAFCDLAGSERLKKTLNVGERLKEAQNINASLLVLGRCLKTIYESQNSNQKTEFIGPFRESKLTRLFQRALSGKEQISLIVNVNPLPNLYDETQNVLNFSAIAKKIVIERVAVKPRRSVSRFSLLVSKSIKTEIDWENTDLEDVSEAIEEQESYFEENNDTAYEDLLDENEMLKKEIQELKSSILIKEMETRQELTDMYTEIMKNIEVDWKNRLTDMEEQQENLREIAVEQIEEYYKNKLNNISVRKRSRPSYCSEDNYNDSKLTLDELEAENIKLSAKIETLKKSVRNLKRSKEEVESEKSKISFELVVAKEEAKSANEMLEMAKETICAGNDVTSEYIDKLIEKINSKDERIKTIKNFLNEAKEEYISITDQAQKMEMQIKKQEELLAENIEYIQDLEEQLHTTNSYSSEQSKKIENLEDELEQQIRKLAEAEETIKSLSKSASDTPLEENIKCSNDECVKTKHMLEEMRLKWEYAEKENEELKEKLNEHTTEFELMKNKFDLLKIQVDEAAKTSSVDETSQKSLSTVDQEIQTEDNDPFFKKLSAIDEKCIKLVNNCYQMSEVETKYIEIDVECQEKLLYLNTPHNTEKYVADKEQIINEEDSENEMISDKAVAKEEYNQSSDNMSKEYIKVKDDVKICETENIDNTEKEFDENHKALTDPINLINEIGDKNQIILQLQDELQQKSLEYEKYVKEDIDSKYKELMDRIQEAHRREEDKDQEIRDLEKELKNLIRTKESCLEVLEIEKRTLLQELMSVKQKLNTAEECNANIEKDYQQSINLLEMKISTMEDKIFESERLKVHFDELKKQLTNLEHEFEILKKSRDETVLKYENLVLSQHEELKQLKKEIKKYENQLLEMEESAASLQSFQSVGKLHRNKVIDSTIDIIDNSFKDDDRQISKIKHEDSFITSSLDNISSIHLSDSEIKQSYEDSYMDNTMDYDETSQVTRRKKMYTSLDAEKR